VRYAVYHLPEGELGARGAAWLGWDAVLGAAMPVPQARGPWVETPRRYGFHATLKPPFRLAEGRDRAELKRAVAAIAARTVPGRAEGLEIASLGGFVALRPTGSSDFSRVAAACVTLLDGFRAPAPPQELARRRAVGLTAPQESHLDRWGYPYVLDQFRYHLTLSGRVDDPEAVIAAARDHFGPLPAPFGIEALSLCVERDGTFRELHRYPLTGAGSTASA
jgi:hypothetical protein